jgi:hypothetical protein
MNNERKAGFPFSKEGNPQNYDIHSPTISPFTNLAPQRDTNSKRGDMLYLESILPHTKAVICTGRTKSSQGALHKIAHHSANRKAGCAVIYLTHHILNPHRDIHIKNNYHIAL